MEIKVVAIGAAGGKAAVELIEEGIVTENRVILINSTLKDVPDDYKHLAIQLSGGKGCGKERELSKTLCLNSIRDNTLEKLDSLVDPTDELVIVVSSTAGGTGSGSTPIIAKYFKEAIGVPVQCFAFTGFEEDGRELQNTIEYFQEMEDVFTVQAISNKKFLDGGSNNKIKAEKLANKEFAKRVGILIGKGMIDSEQNIDESDLFKISTTPGYMDISSVDLSNIKNIDQFNKALTLMLDEDKALETNEKGMLRLGVFLNIPEKMYDFVDYNFTVLKERLGNPYEVFSHIQYNEDLPIGLSFISSGMKMPIDEVKEIYKKYKEESDKVNKSKDNFFDFASGLRGNQEDSMFNSATNRRSASKSKADFLNGMSFGTVKESNNAVENITVKNNNHNDKKEVKKLNKEEFVKNNF